MLSEPIEITLLVIETLERLGIRYLLTGSFAGAIYGNPRATRDADLLADIRSDHVHSLVESLDSDFNVSRESIELALKNRSSFNVIHYQSVFKIDIFVPKNQFDEQELERISLRVISPDPLRSAFVASVEDIILAKLSRYRQGNEVSEQQWRDITVIFDINRAFLDMDYLQKTSTDLGVHDLLQKLNPQ